MFSHTSSIRTGGIEYHNKTSAPWISTEIFMAGCYKDCPGCFNQELRDLTSGRILPVSYVAADFIRHVPYKKVTFSGGEPFLQAKALSKLAEILKVYNFFIVCYSGYMAEELPHLFPSSRDLLEHIDILVDGPYIEGLKVWQGNDFEFVGSSNQRVINVQKSLDEGQIIPWTDKDTMEVK